MIGVNPVSGVADDYDPTGAGLAPGEDCVEGTIEISARIRHGNLDFTMRDIEGNFVRYQNGERFVAIEGATRLTIRLSDVINWEFDTAQGPLRFKREQAASHYRVLVVPGQEKTREIILEAQLSGLEAHAAGASEVHSFNLYLKVNQRLGSAWPIRLDPDVKYPPPPPR